jgi:hypothetical protein
MLGNSLPEAALLLWIECRDPAAFLPWLGLAGMKEAVN